jgi:hypothetical protein
MQEVLQELGESLKQAQKDNLDLKARLERLQEEKNAVSSPAPAP